MARRCTVCDHPAREAVDRELVAGGSNRAVACQFGVNRSAVQRHAARHLPKHLAEAAEAERVSDAGSLLAQVQGMLVKARHALDRAEQAKDDRLGAVWFRELRSTLELLGRVTRELQPETAVTVQVGLLQQLGVRDLEDAKRRIAASLEYEQLDEDETARRMRAWLERYDAARPEQRIGTPH
jgi:hypothetical protein